jgi:frataxin
MGLGDHRDAFDESAAILDDSSFAITAEHLLELLADTIDAALGDDIDADLQNGILTLSLEAGGQYVINKNAPLKQIWLSSPVSGAWHFEFAAGAWVSTREPKLELRAVLAGELADKFGVAVPFPVPSYMVARAGGKGG